MKRILYIIMGAVALQSQVSIRSQQPAKAIFNEEIPVKIQRLNQVDDSVLLVMDLDLKEVNLGTDRSLVLTPVLSDGIDHEIVFKNVMLNGRQRHKAFTREVELNGWERDVAKAHYSVLDLKENRRAIRYRASTSYEPWMRNAHLDVRTDLCGCAGHAEQLGTEKVANRIVMQDAKVYSPMADVAYITPAVEEVKARSESHNVFLDFPVARTEINPQFGNNPRELPKIEQIVNDVRSDQNVNVSGVMITGYASPEGSTDFNNQLSRGRAEALRNYLSMRSNIPLQMYQVGYGGEDWTGLAELVQKSYIEPKSAILNIIYGSNGEARKQQLKSLGGGTVYQRLLNGLYPQLRRVVAKIDYTVRKFNVEEARQIIRTHPQQLSLNEMYILANSYKEGSKDFMGIFETAVQYFPADPVANLNAAAIALLRRDMAEAERYLDKAEKNTPEYYNNLGVLEMMKKNYPRARNLFKRASESGLGAASKNLNELSRKEESDKLLQN